MDSVFRTPQLHIIGEIVGAEGFESTKVYARWQMYVGTDWRLLSGMDSGETFYDYSEHAEDISVFEHPLDLHYVCKTISGWPRLYMEVWTVDTHGRHSLGGYGQVVIPAAPGHYELRIHLWRPHGNFWERIKSHLLGAVPELLHKQMVISGNDRFGLNATTTGSVLVRVGIITKDFHLHGIIMN